ncbi:MAG: hypothetical protein KF799_05310 [Bdellovibrionales bacterium]|nr:hypothetical protein [Bdellovibrionales bacterium]
MQDTNWKTWGLLFLVAIGISFELLKSLGGGFNKVTPREGLAQGRPYAVKQRTLVQSHRAPVVRPQAVQVAAQTGGITREMMQKFAEQHSPASTTFDKAKDKDKGEEKKKKDYKCDEHNQRIDLKTGKPMVHAQTGKPLICKKKKEKKEEEKPAVADNKKEEPRKPSDDIDAMIGQAIATGEIPQPIANDKPDDAFNTLEEWMKRLLNFPDKEETKRFIDHYQRNLVSAEIYYKITEMMLNDSRSQMKQLGVMCAGLTPSVLSFQLLADLIKNEHSGSAARTDAEGFMTRYTDINSLTILERVMRASNTSFATVLATQKLDLAAHRFLQKKDTAPSTGTPTQQAQQQAAQTASMKRNASYFQRFVLVLTELSKAPDATVKDQAGRTLTNLTTLLSAVTGTQSGPGPITGQPDDQGPIAAQSIDASGF